MQFTMPVRAAGVCLALFGTMPPAIAQPEQVSGSPSVTVIPSNVKIIPFTFIKVDHSVLHWQETSQWCWAASGQMVMEEAGKRTVPQCYQANQRFGRTDCCTCPTPAACVRPGWPEWDTWGFNYKSANPLSWSDLVAQINANKPFAFAWGWTGGGGHMMVAYGYFSRWGQNNFVYVDNPWPPQGRCGPGGTAAGPFGGDWEFIAYATFLGGSGYDHVFWGADYDVTPK